MPRRARGPIAGMLVAALAVFTSTASARDADPLRDVRTAWEQAMLAGDARAAAALFTEDAVQMRPGRATNRGRAAVEAGYAEDFRAATVTAVRMNPSNTQVEHGRALEHGTFTITWSERSGQSPPLALHGRYLLWARKTAQGHWQIEVEMHTIEPDVPEAQLR